MVRRIHNPVCLLIAGVDRACNAVVRVLGLAVHAAGLRAAALLAIAPLVIVALQGAASLTLAIGALVTGGTSVAILAWSFRIVVDAAIGGVAGVFGADIAVIAIQGLAGQALPLFAAIDQSARVVVGAGCGV